MHRRSNLQCGQVYRDFSINPYDVTGKINCDTSSLPQSMRPMSNRFCGNYDYTKNGLRTFGAYPTKTCSKLYKEKKPIQTAVIQETPTQVTVQTSTPATVVVEEPVVKVTEEPVVQITADMTGKVLEQKNGVKVTEEPAVKVTEEKVLAVETFTTKKPVKEGFTNGRVVERMAPYPQSLMSYSAYPYVTLYDIPTVRPIPQYSLQQVPFYYSDGVMMPATVATRNSSVPVTFIPNTPILAGNRCAGNNAPILIGNDRNFAVMPHFVPTVPAATATIGVPTRNNNLFVAFKRD